MWCVVNLMVVCRVVWYVWMVCWCVCFVSCWCCCVGKVRDGVISVMKFGLVVVVRVILRWLMRMVVLLMCCVV